MALVVYIVGKKGSGKTSLIEALVREMRGRGIKVSTIKHAPEGFTKERGKDTTRHLDAGSLFTALLSPEGGFIEWRGEKEPEDMERLLDESDIILVEGFKGKKGFKIEVLRDGELMTDEEELSAIVTDRDMKTSIPVFRTKDIKGISDFITERMREEVSLYTDGEKIPLNPFVQSFIKGTIKGMISSLKKVGSLKNIKIVIRGNHDS